MGAVLQGVLLDLDDTLVDTRGAFHAAIAHISRRWLPHLDEAGVDEATLRWAHDPGGYFRAYARGELSFGVQRRLRVTDLHEAYGGPVLDDDGFAAWDQAFDKGFREGWRLHDDVEDLLDRLLAAGLAVGCLTNSTRELSVAKLDRLGLAQRLPLLVSPDDLGFGKPDPRVFRLGCERLGTEPAHTAYVGDELDTDAQAALAAGLVGVWIDRFGTRPALDPAELHGVLVASDLGEVADLLAPGRRDLGAPDARR